MGKFKIILLVGLIGLVSFFLLFSKNKSVELPEDIKADSYWGKKFWKKGDPIPKDDVTIRPFKITYDEAIINDLNQRLDKAKFMEPLEDNFYNGFNGEYLKKVIHHWRNNYNWKKQIEFLNKFPQFKTEIEGLDIHFVRIKPVGNPKIVKTIMLVNGWPSNYYHYFKLADLLRQPVNDIAFEIVIPSRPGYGFSSHPKRPGFSVLDGARIYVKLMKRLGLNKFYFAGEDWGSIEMPVIAHLYKENIEGLHSSMALADMNLKAITKLALGSYFPSLIYSNEKEAKIFANPSKILPMTIKEMGYFMMQSTKPDTIGTAILNNPVGLAVYVLEKFCVWVNPNHINLQDGGLTKNGLTLDELLDNIMIYWITENGAYSLRYYKEAMNLLVQGIDVGKLPISHDLPVGYSIGEHELEIGKIKPDKYNIVKFDYIDGTGHFSSFENPKEVNKHLREFVSIVMQLNDKKTKEEL